MLSEHTCRLCLAEDESSFNSNSIIKSLPLHEMVDFCIGVQLNPKSGRQRQQSNTSTICNECVMNVSNFYTFKKKILQAQTMLGNVHAPNEDADDQINHIDVYVETLHEAETKDNQQDELHLEFEETTNEDHNDPHSANYGDTNEGTQYELFEIEGETETVTRKQPNKRPSETSAEVTSKNRSISKKSKPEVNANDEKVTTQITECLICPAILGDILKLNDHVLSHGTMQCKACKRSFARYSNLKRHFNVMHSKPKPFVCDLCGLGFSFSVNLQTHAALHYSGKIKMKS